MSVHETLSRFDRRSADRPKPLDADHHELLPCVAALMEGDLNAGGTGYSTPPATIMFKCSQEGISVTVAPKDGEWVLFTSVKSLPKAFLELEALILGGHYKQVPSNRQK